MSAAEYPPVFDTSVKIGDPTAKGNKLSVHVYGNGREATVDEAVDVYIYAVEQCKLKNIPLAPIEVEEKK